MTNKTYTKDEAAAELVDINVQLNANRAARGLVRTELKETKDRVLMLVKEAKDRVLMLERERTELISAFCRLDRVRAALYRALDGKCQGTIISASTWDLTEEYCKNAAKPDSPYCGVHRNRQ